MSAASLLQGFGRPPLSSPGDPEQPGLFRPLLTWAAGLTANPLAMACRRPRPSLWVPSTSASDPPQARPPFLLCSRRSSVGLGVGRSSTPSAREPGRGVGNLEDAPRARLAPVGSWCSQEYALTVPRGDHARERLLSPGLQMTGAAGREATRVQFKCPDVCECALVLLHVGSYALSLTRERFWPNSFFAESCAAPRLSQGPAGCTLLLGTVSRAVWPRAPPHPQPGYGAHVLLPRAPRGGFGGCPAVF